MEGRGFFRWVVRAVRWMLRLEFSTEVGRYNLVGTLCLLLITALLAAANGVVELARVVVSLVHPDVAKTGVDWSWIFVVFGLLMFVCVAMLGTYEFLTRRDQRRG